MPSLEHPRKREKTRLPRLARHVAVHHEVGVPRVAKVVAVVEGDLQAEGLTAEPWSGQYVHPGNAMGSGSGMEDSQLAVKSLSPWASVTGTPWSRSSPSCRRKSLRR